MSVWRTFESIVQSSPRRAAVITTSSATTFLELHERAHALGRGLLVRGARPGSRVAYLAENRVQAFELFLGSSAVGVVPLAVNWRLSPREVAATLADAHAELLIIDASTADLARDALDDLMQPPQVITIGDVAGDDSFEGLIERGKVATTRPTKAPQMQDVALQVYTSGTTGQPKGALLTNDNIASLLLHHGQQLGISASSVVQLNNPIFHVGGSIWGLAALLSGAALVIAPSNKAADIVRCVAENRVTHCALMPTVLQDVLEVPDLKGDDLRTLENISYGGSPMTVRLLSDALEVMDCDFLGAYGLTEACGQVATLAAEHHRLKVGSSNRLKSVGLPVPGAEIAIRDPDGLAELTPGDVGEIWVRSRQIMRGYFRQPKETRAAVSPDGWLRTGDGGYRDSDGFLYLTDRIKDMIISGGENVYPAEVENVLAAHPGVAEVAVVGTPHPRWGETVKAFAARRPGSEVTEGELTGYARERLARYKCPSTVVWLEELPRNPSGKILKDQLRASDS